MLRRAARCALRNTLIPISTVIVGNTDTSIAGPNAYRAGSARLDDWVIGFARAAELAADNAARLAEDIETLDGAIPGAVYCLPAQARMLSHRAAMRSCCGSSTTLATTAVLTTESVASRLGGSTAAVHRALTELADAGILGRTNYQKGRLICWTADRQVALVALTERSNRVGGGDTQNRSPRIAPLAPDPAQVGVLRPPSVRSVAI